MTSKVNRTPDQLDIRILKTESGSDLAELADTGFANEDQLHRLIEGNIGTLFHGLTFIKREFRELGGGRHIPDTVAFDTEQNTFVVIEYKNKLDTGVIDQTKAYLKYMKKNKEILMLEYAKNEGGGALDRESYNWDVYAIIMAPEFSKNQIDSAKDDGDLELHEIRRYSESVMMVRRAGGAHEGSPARRKRFHEPPDGMSPLYANARAKLLSAFPGMVEKQMKLYDRFSIGGQLFCTMDRQKSKIWLHYLRSISNPAPDRPEFVSFVGVPGWGLGRWRPVIRSMSDFDLALDILKKMYAAGRPEPNLEKKAERKPGRKTDRETWSCPQRTRCVS